MAEESKLQAMLQERADLERRLKSLNAQIVAERVAERVAAYAAAGKKTRAELKAERSKLWAEKLAERQEAKRAKVRAEREEADRFRAAREAREALIFAAHMEGKKAPQIAKELGLSVGNVRYVLGAGRRLEKQAADLQAMRQARAKAEAAARGFLCSLCDRPIDSGEDHVSFRMRPGGDRHRAHLACTQAHPNPAIARILPGAVTIIEP